MWQVLTGSLMPEQGIVHPNRVHVEQTTATDLLALSLHEHMALVATPSASPVVVCIGTDRSTGDSLGPLIGTALQERMAGLSVYGTLEEPVHAANLSEVLDVIANSCPGKPVLAVDACLGKSENVGYISVKLGPLRPGTGVNKKLPPVGDLHVVGVVNVGGFMEYFVLQNTRLSLVMRMAGIIASSIEKCLQEHWFVSVSNSTQPSVSVSASL